MWTGYSNTSSVHPEGTVQSVRTDIVQQRVSTSQTRARQTDTSDFTYSGDTGANPCFDVSHQDITDCTGPQSKLTELNADVKKSFHNLRLRIQVRRAICEISLLAPRWYSIFEARCRAVKNEDISVSADICSFLQWALKCVIIRHFWQMWGKRLDVQTLLSKITLVQWSSRFGYEFNNCRLLKHIFCNLWKTFSIRHIQDQLYTDNRYICVLPISARRYIVRAVICTNVTEHALCFMVTHGSEIVCAVLFLSQDFEQMALEQDKESEKQAMMVQVEGHRKQMLR